MLARLLAALALLALAATGFLLTAAAVRPASPAGLHRIAVVVPTTTTATPAGTGYTPVPAGPPATAPASR